MTYDHGVLLINSKDGWFDDGPLPINLNLGLLRTATLLHQHGYDVRMVDLLTDHDSRRVIEDYSANLDVCLAVVSVNSKAIASGLEVSRRLKRMSPHLPIAWANVGRAFFGPLVTLYPEVVLADESVDFICTGMGYEILTLVESLISGPLHGNLAGVGYKTEDGRLVLPIPTLQPRRDLPAEDYALVDMERYIHRTGFECLMAADAQVIRKIIPVSTGEGCAYRCSFCINSHPQVGGTVRLKTIETLTAQLDELVKDYDPDIVWFQDDNLFVNKERALALLDHMEERKYRFKWVAQGRLNYFRDGYLDEAFFERIAGKCLWFGVGFETFSDRLRAIYGKEVTTEMLYHAADLADRHGVPLNPAVITGTLDQTNKEAVDDVLGILDFKAQFPLAGITYQQYRPYPGTEEHRKLKEAGYLAEEPQTIEGLVDGPSDWPDRRTARKGFIFTALVFFAAVAYFRPGHSGRRWLYQALRPLLAFWLRHSSMVVEVAVLRRLSGVLRRLALRFVR